MTSRLRQGMQGSAVANLQGALLLRIEHQGIKTFTGRNRPTVKELQTLTKTLKQERGQEKFDDATRQLVRYFQSQQKLGDRLAGVVEAKTAAALNKLLTDLGALSLSPPFVVSGRVYSAERAGVGGLHVQVVDKNAGPDVMLAEGVPDERGQYALSYSTAKVVRQGKRAPDIQARVSSGRTFLGASEVRYNATPSETLDVLLPATAADALLSEHATLTGAIAAHYTGKLKELQESNERSDITYLANKTGWDARALALAALADQFSAGTAPPRASAPTIAPEFFYALFRAGLPANEDILYGAAAETLKAIWTQAAEQGVIPKSLTKTIPAAVKQFGDLSGQKMLTAPALIGASSLKQMLASARLTAAQQQQFAALYTAHRMDVPGFLEGDRQGARSCDGALAVGRQAGPDQRSDITYLANKTGWDARAVALAALADQFSALSVPPSGVTPTVASVLSYALLRAGLSPNEDMLYRADASAPTNIWNQAADEGVVPSSIKSTVPAVVQRFQDC